MLRSFGRAKQFGCCEDQQRQTLLWNSRWLFINYGSRSSFDVVGCCLAAESLPRHNHPWRSSLLPINNGSNMCAAPDACHHVVVSRYNFQKELLHEGAASPSQHWFSWLIFMTYDDADRSCSSPQPTNDQLPIYFILFLEVAFHRGMLCVATT